MNVESRVVHAGPLLHWLRLLRIPNVFTAIADTTMGVLVAEGAISRPILWATLVLSTCCLYLAGMVMNDLFDLDLDRRERPERPLPAGLISISAARCVAAVLWLSGIVAAWAAHWQSSSPAVMGAGVWGSLLALCILSYDFKLKSTPFGPWAMGACRGLNIAMAMSVAVETTFHQSPVPGMIVGAIGLYVVGITTFAKHETVVSPRLPLILGLLLMMAGIALLTQMHAQYGWPRRPAVTFRANWIWPVFIWLMMVPVWRHALKAIYMLRPSDIQFTVKQAIMALIVLDAGIALVAAGPYYAFGVFLLSLPATYLARFVAMT